MSSINRRIEIIANYYNVSAYELSKKLDTSTTRISHILNDRNKPNYELLKSICEYFPDVDARWLLTGEGEMFTYNLSKRFEEDMAEIKMKLNLIKDKVR